MEGIDWGEDKEGNTEGERKKRPMTLSTFEKT